NPIFPIATTIPTVGEETGIQVARINRTSDGSEPFNDLLSQANGRTPPRRKKKALSAMTMRGKRRGPRGRRNTGRRPMDADSSATPRANASRSSLREPSVDFDGVPSPRRVSRKSAGRAGPSRLAAHEQDEGEEDGMDNYDQQDNFGGQEEEDEENLSHHPKEARCPPPASTHPMGKGRAFIRVDEEEEEEIEDDIARGMEDVDQGGKATPAPTKPKVVRSRPLQKENRNVPDGVRRSQRIPYPPLEHWRGEKVVYAPRDPDQKRQGPAHPRDHPYPQGAPAPAPPVSKRKPRPLAHHGKAGGHRARGDRGDRRSNPEAGWDDETNPTAVVLDYHTSGNMFNPKPAKVTGPDDAWSFEKIFGDGDFMAAGQLVIPVGKRKPGKGTKDNTTWIFYVVEGAVNVVVCDTSFVLATGGMFMARKMREDEEEEGEPAASRGVSVAMGARSGSAVSMGVGRR
ncbi:hypothetical protein B0H14DRAFT_2826110, partial [Mycena olivaceomarginata]